MGNLGRRPPEVQSPGLQAQQQPGRLCAPLMNTNAVQAKFLMNYSAPPRARFNQRDFLLIIAPFLAERNDDTIV